MTTEIRHGDVYTAPSMILRTDVRSVASAGDRCFLQIIERWGLRAYLVYAAASLENLQDDSRAFVVLLEDEQLEWASLYTRPREESAARYVAPARILPPELRKLASCAGLCYFAAEGAPDEQGQVRARVAALAERLHAPSPAVYVTLRSQDLAQALPVTRELEALPTCDLRGLLEDHANQVTGSLLPECAGAPQQVERSHAEPEPVSVAAQEPAATLEIEMPLDAIRWAATGPRGESSQASSAPERPDRANLALILVRAALRIVSITRGRERKRGGARASELAEQELWLRSMLVWRERWSQVPGQYVQVVEVDEGSATVRIGIHPSLLPVQQAEVEGAAA
jgi:hypothetical protein